MIQQRHHLPQPCLSHVHIHGLHQLRSVPPHLLPSTPAQMPMEPGQVGSYGQHRRAVVLHLRILLVFLAERGRYDRRKLQLVKRHVHRYCRDQRDRLHAARSSCVQGTSRVLGSVEGEIGQSAIKVIDQCDICIGKRPINQQVLHDYSTWTHWPAWSAASSPQDFI